MFKINIPYQKRQQSLSPENQNDKHYFGFVSITEGVKKKQSDREFNIYYTTAPYSRLSLSDLGKSVGV